MAPERKHTRKPDREEQERARGSSVPDVIGKELDILFCGINPGLYSGATGHHFARPGNRFWKALHLSGLTPGCWSPGRSSNCPGTGSG